MKSRMLFLATLGVLVLGSCNQSNTSKDEATENAAIDINAVTLGNAPSMEPVEIMKLYEGVAPGSETWKHHEVNDNGVLFNITEPTLAVYLPEPEKATGSAMVICPGGGFAILSYVSEGTMVAQELCKRGIAAFVLKYRTTPLLDEQGNGSEDIQDAGKAVEASVSVSLQMGLTAVQACMRLEYSRMAFADADRAMTLVRQNASKWGVQPDKIGIMGFSAGAVTTMHQALTFSEQSKPNFTGVIYGGWTPDVKAPAEAAPMFLCAPVNDIFSPEESMDVYKAWRTANIPVELHFYQSSEHGYGAVPTGKSSDLWIEEMYRFMKDCGFVSE